MVDDVMGDAQGDRKLRQVLRSITDDDRTFSEPPPGLWDKIATAAGIVDDVAPAEARLAEVVPLTPRGRWGLAFLAGAAALVALVVSFAAWRAVSEEDDITIIASVPITSAGLDTSSEYTGQAELIEENGALFVRLDVNDLPAPDGYIEAWLIDTDVQGMYPLGAVTGDVRLPVPSGVVPTDFPIIDLSVEPLDGDPTHSGVSILRGQLPL